MLLALGPLQLDPTVRTVVVGLVAARDRGCIERATLGADALWLSGGATPDDVADACERTGLPVGVTADDPALLRELVAAGAVAAEATGSVDVADVATTAGLSLWCSAAGARRAIDAGVPATRIVVEPPGDGALGNGGATVVGSGPATWGSVVRGVLGGVRVVRTEDVFAARRVVTVVDRLLAARSATGEEVAG